MDNKLFEQIFQACYSDIYNFVYHYVMDQDDAQDLTQDTFISFYDKYSSLPAGVEPKQCLMVIAKNRCFSFLRHKHVTDRHNLKYFESEVFTAEAGYDTTYDELLEQLHLAMEHLTDLQKQIIEMKLQGKDYKEMGERLHLTTEQVHKQVKKTYARIREIVNVAPRESKGLLLLLLADLFR